jgi:hypothetical protein
VRLSCAKAEGWIEQTHRWLTQYHRSTSPERDLALEVEELGRIQSTDVVLPLGEDLSREIRIRCIIRPDRDQAMLLDRLGLRLPERLRAPIRIDTM